MRIGAVTLAYNDEGIIKGTLNCLKPFVDKHVVLISKTPYFGKPSPPDNTEKICRDFGCEVILGEWELDHHQRTLGNQLCSDCDWVITFDSDEMMTSDELTKFIKFLENTKAEAVVTKPIVYFKSTDYILDPPSDYMPIIATKPYVEFTYIRNIDRGFAIYEGIMHHVSWAEPKDIQKKVLNYAHATDFDGAKWYKEHYENWNGGKIILPTETFNSKYQPLPEELKRYL